MLRQRWILQTAETLENVFYKPFKDTSSAFPTDSNNRVFALGEELSQCVWRWGGGAGR